MTKETGPELAKNNLDKTFDHFDKLDLKSFAEKLIKHVVAEYPHVEGSLVMSLNGQFGSGKSCFLEMMKNRLEVGQEYDVIHINAWKNDFFDEPVVTIASEIIDHLNKKKGLDEEITSCLKETLFMVIGSCAIATNQVINKFTGINVKECAEIVEKDMKDRDEKMGNAIFKEYVEKSNLFEQLNKSLKSYISSLENKPLFILVDELDRSRPNYAVHFLETLKHFFQTKGVVFILGVDKGHLESSIRCLYGDLDFSEYYRKFIHRNVSLPKPDENAVLSYIKSKVEEYFGQGRADRFYTNNIIEYVQEQICEICNCFNLSPRQVDEFFRILSHTLTAQQGTKKVHGILLAAILYIAILLDNEENAKRIREGSFLYQDYIQLFEKHGLIKKDNLVGSSWWAEMTLYIIKTKENYQANTDFLIEYLHPFILISAQDQAYQAQQSYLLRGAQSILGSHHGSYNGSGSFMDSISKKVDMCLNFFD
jgi:deoxyadenosine/deoxycytidine kinase